MKYTIRTDKDGKILAVNRWKPILTRKPLTPQEKKDGKKNGVLVANYKIPTELEFISKEKYEELCGRIDLPYIRWIGGTILEEYPEEKEIRIQRAKKRSIERQRNKVKNLLKELDGFITLTSKGKKLLSEK